VLMVNSMLLPCTFTFSMLRPTDPELAAWPSSLIPASRPTETERLIREEFVDERVAGEDDGDAAVCV